FAKMKKLKMYGGEFISDHFLEYCWRVTHCVRAARRGHVLKELGSISSKYKMLFVTDSPESLRKKIKKENISLLPFQPWGKVVGFFKQAKLVINVQPYHIHGPHERLYSAMACGCVGVTDRNPFLEKHFTHGKDIIFYDFKKGDLREKIEFFLQKPDLLREISKRGQDKVLKHGMPKNWVQTILANYSKYQEASAGRG
ncbi:MAG: glycosyltransferase, partial [Gammaproteobacteria bacterium]|nr:glycosyltransferase [Gammaproteobacteria bacterium]